jgi:hypothetical protein
MTSNVARSAHPHAQSLTAADADYGAMGLLTVEHRQMNVLPAKGAARRFKPATARPPPSRRQPTGTDFSFSVPTSMMVTSLVKRYDIELGASGDSSRCRPLAYQDVVLTQVLDDHGHAIGRPERHEDILPSLVNSMPTG